MVSVVGVRVIITSHVCLIPGTVLNFGTVHLVHTFGASNDLLVVCMKQNRVELIKAVREFFLMQNNVELMFQLKYCEK